MNEKIKNVTAVPAIILAVLLFVSLSNGCQKKIAVPPHPNVILITIDTLRADHLSCYGYHRQTSPFIDSIAKQGVLFEQAYATSSWTAPSMASIFTGHFCRNHGVLHGVAKGPKAAIHDQEQLTAEFHTIAEAFKSAGYTTFGVSSNGHVSKGTGFAQGFDHFKTHWFMKSPATNSTVKKWARLIREAPRYFLWLHYFDPHNPYSPRMPWIKNYTIQSKSYSKWTREEMGDPRGLIEEIKKDPQALDTLVDRYDSEINYCDQYIREVFEVLQPGPDTLIIITSDHGEAFLDHGQMMHGDTLFEEEVRIPLVVKFPGDNISPGLVIPHPVSNRNIFATVMDFTGLLKDRAVPGKSLMPLISGTISAQPEDIFYELDWIGWGQAIRQGKWKFMASGRKEKGYFLFDIETDPGETRNLYHEFPEQVKTLETSLKQWLSANPEFKAPRIKLSLDRDQENKLKTLGYL